MGLICDGLRVAMVTPWHVRCGIATYSENLVKALAEQGTTIYVVRLSRFGQKVQDSLLNVVQQIPVDKIDLIHIQHEYGIFQGLEREFYVALKSLGKPLITTMHAVGVRVDTDIGIATTSDQVVVHNKFCADRLGYKSTIIPHGAVPSKTMEVEKAKLSFGIDPRTPIVGYVGFISNYKGLELLIEAITKVPKAALLIAGGWHTETDTPYIMTLKQKSLEVLPSRCQWVGYIPDERLSAAYGAMDVVVYPSRYATESGALIMALGYGKAVLASNIEPFKEKEKVGALMTFKGVRDLTRKIKRLLKDEELRRQLEEGAKKYCEETSWNKIAEKHIALYKQLLSL
jgi:glycosyltransferase involved in cell wall biosynthesis